METVQRVYNFYNWSESFADSRVADWPLIPSPLPMFGIISVYLFVVLIAGPMYMANRSPMDLGNFLPTYNFALVALNCYIVKEVFIGTYYAGYNYWCTPFSKGSKDPYELMVANSVWWFYVSKLVELFDTVLFVLRKRSRQISFLHVYHHATMPLLAWVVAKWLPGGQTFFCVLTNSGIHILMYTYYGLAAMGPKVQKYLWWKKYLTILQLIQFVLDISHDLISIYNKCPYIVELLWINLCYCATFILLFGNFYIRTYSTKGKVAKSD